MLRRALALALTLAPTLVGCTDGSMPNHANAPPPPSASTAPSASAPVVPKDDPLGPKPTLASPKVFVPAIAEELTVTTHAASGGKVKVWLQERHKLPIVAMTLAIGAGSARDPAGKFGLAHVTGDMLDEGAGRFDAVGLSSAFEDLGASFSISVGADATYVSLTVLRASFEKALALVADVVLRPKLDKKEFARVHELWENDLKARAASPGRVARLAVAKARYGASHPYGHASEGAVAHAKDVTLDEVKKFRAEFHRPSLAAIGLAGDVTKADAEKLLAKAFSGWAEPKAAVPALSLDVKGFTPPRLVLIDRPGAPQSVVAMIGAGPAAADADAPLVELVNTALGASFTSRLNQNLREEKGWTYGARSSFTETRGPGFFYARAEVQEGKTIESLDEMEKELAAMKKQGLTAAELLKVKAQDRASLVEAYEGVGGVASRLATLAILGLPRSFDPDATKVRQASELPGLLALGKWFDGEPATRVVVGPLAGFRSKLPAAWGKAVQWTAEGDPVP